MFEGENGMHDGEDEGMHTLKELIAAVDDELEHELNVLRAIPGVDRIAAYPKGRFDPTRFNKNKKKNARNSYV